MNIDYSENDDNITQVIRLNNHGINTTSSLKLLGVTTDSELNFSEHINMICKKASQKIGVLMRLKNLIPTNARLVFLKQQYCHTLHTATSDSRKMERLKERGLHAVFRKNASYPELLKRAKLPSLLNRRVQDIRVLMYKVKNNQCPLLYISDIFINHRSKYNLRQSDFSAAKKKKGKERNFQV